MVTYTPLLHCCATSLPVYFFVGVQKCLKNRTLQASYTFIPLSVLLQVHSLFHSEFPTDCELVCPLSISIILSFP
jgi:hypothetical protein